MMRQDQELERSVRELLRNSRVNYRRIDVDVDAGNVTFRGVVESEEDREHLEEIGRMVSGIGNINFEVTLKH